MWNIISRWTLTSVPFIFHFKACLSLLSLLIYLCRNALIMGSVVAIDSMSAEGRGTICVTLMRYLLVTHFVHGAARGRWSWVSVNLDTSLM